MKNKILLGFVFAVCLSYLALIVSNANADSAAISILSISLTDQNPYPVEPGQVVDIQIAIQNTGLVDAENLVVEIEPQSPFTLLQGQDKIKNFNRILAKGQVTTSYKLHVDESAITDTYNLKFRYYKNGSAVDITKEIPIEVQGNPKLVIDSITTFPHEIEPGEIVEITVNIKNVGTGNAYNVEAKMNSSSTYILPVLSGGVYFAGDINHGETKEASFKFSVDTSAEYKTYVSLLQLAYKDDTGSLSTTSFDVGIPIYGKPLIDILSAKVDGSDFKVDIENIGTGSAKALIITLVQNGEIKDVGISNELKPTKHQTIRFNGFAYGEAKINITYLDESNSEHTYETPVSIKPSVQNEGQSSNEGVSSLSIFLVIVIVVETIYIWRLRKHRKK